MCSDRQIHIFMFMNISVLIENKRPNGGLFAMMKLQMSVCLRVCIKMASNGVKKMGNSQEQLKTKTAVN